MDFISFVGIDASMRTFDAASVLTLKKVGDPFYLGNFPNNAEGFGSLVEMLVSRGHVPSSTLVCIDHIGPYSEKLSIDLHDRGFKVWLASPLLIRKSIGLVRAKSDRIDSRLVTQFAARFNDMARIFAPAAQWVENLRNFGRLRAQMIRDRTRLSNQMHANQSKANPCQATLESQTRRMSLLEREIAAVDEKIQLETAASVDAKRTDKILRSIPGIGKVTSLLIILATAAMTNVDDWRQLSTMARSMPFPRQSGTSLNHRPRVSKMGDRKLKTALYMGAMSVIRPGQYYHEYYTSRIAMGKAHNSVINDIINKMLKLAFDLCKKCEQFNGDIYLQNKKSMQVTLTLS